MSNFPAFPFEYHNQTRDYQKSFVTDKMLPPDASEQYSGLTARDYFAAKAMMGIISNEAMIQRHREVASENSIGEETLLATSAYSLADAMLAERDK